MRILRSYALKLAALVVIIAAVPALIYDQLRAADQERLELLRSSLRHHAQLIAAGLTPLLVSEEVPSPEAIEDELRAYEPFGELSVRLLFRPSDATAAGFLYVAAIPTVSSDRLETERKFFVEQGLLERVVESCGAGRSVSIRFEAPDKPRAADATITPVKAPAGCWAVVVTFTETRPHGAQLDVPYWGTRQVQMAFAIYGAMAVFVLLLFIGAWRNLRGFARTAQRLADGDTDSTFRAENRIPELSPVASSFDQLVASLRRSAEAVRRAAEDNAHAFKTPIATVQQALEPLQRRLEALQPDQRRAVEVIDSAVRRLDSLVRAVRQLEEGTADLVGHSYHRIDLSALVRREVTSFEDLAEDHRVSLVSRIEDGIGVRGSAEAIEIVLENLVTNALDFTPAGRHVTVTLAGAGEQAVLTVIDDGPGVPEDHLPQIFDRYFSVRPESHAAQAGSHFGIGLWIVRRNVEALGGTVAASNQPEGGLAMTVTLPRAARRR